MKPLNLVASSDLESKKVIDIVGHEYGSIKDLIIDPNNNKILLAVISEGGFAGTDLGSDYVAIPWKSLNVNPNTYTCTLKVDREIVNKAPRVDYNDLKDGKYEVIEQILNYYGLPGKWNEGKSMDNIESAEAINDQHQTYKGSEYQTKDVPEEDSRMGTEMDFDKLTGKSDK